MTFKNQDLGGKFLSKLHVPDTCHNGKILVGFRKQRISLSSLSLGRAYEKKINWCF